MSSDSLPVPSETGRVPFRSYETWYAIYGDLTASAHPPLIVLHGGPGAGHDYLQCLGTLSETAAIPVIMYDQVGCGRSTHIRDAPAGTFTIQFFLGELDNVLSALDIKEYDLLGQSWGGMLACEHATLNLPGLRRLILAGSPASITLAESVRIRCYQSYPARLRDAMFAHNAGGPNTDEYWEAKEWFRRTNQCRLDPWPEEMVATWENIRQDPTVLLQLLGPSDLYVTGALKGWSIINRLPLLKVSVLAIHGAFDWCGQEAADPFRSAECVKKAVTLEGAGHMAHLDQRESFLREVIQFLSE